MKCVKIGLWILILVAVLTTSVAFLLTVWAPSMSPFTNNLGVIGLFTTVMSFSILFGISVWKTLREDETQ